MISLSDVSKRQKILAAESSLNIFLQKPGRAGAQAGGFGFQKSQAGPKAASGQAPKTSLSVTCMFIYLFIYYSLYLLVPIVIIISDTFILEYRELFLQLLKSHPEEALGVLEKLAADPQNLI